MGRLGQTGEPGRLVPTPAFEDCPWHFEATVVRDLAHDIVSFHPCQVKG